MKIGIYSLPAFDSVLWSASRVKVSYGGYYRYVIEVMVRQDRKPIAT